MDVRSKQLSKFNDMQSIGAGSLALRQQVHEMDSQYSHNSGMIRDNNKMPDCEMMSNGSNHYSIKAINRQINQL